jgi:hypothetical protein
MPTSFEEPLDFLPACSNSVKNPIAQKIHKLVIGVARQPCFGLVVMSPATA